VQHLLAAKPPSVGRHNRDYLAAKHVNLERKIGVSIVIVWHSLDDYSFVYW